MGKLAASRSYTTGKRAGDTSDDIFDYTVAEKEQAAVLSVQRYLDLEWALKVHDLLDPTNPWPS